MSINEIQVFRFLDKNKQIKLEDLLLAILYLGI
jgi:hypothetical protein